MTRRTTLSLLFLTGSSALYIASGPVDAYPTDPPTLVLPALHLGPDVPEQLLHVTIVAESVNDIPTEVMDLVGLLRTTVLAGEGAATLSLAPPQGGVYDLVLSSETPEVDLDLPWTACDGGVCRAEFDLAYWTEGDQDVLLEPVMELWVYNSNWDDVDEALAWTNTWARVDAWPFEEDAR